MVGYNDLQTLNPEVASDWHPQKNEGITPQEFTVGSHRKVWWFCENCGHEWNTTIKDRVKSKGCPKCAKRKNKQ